MTEPNEGTMTVGLLLESAHAQQRMAEQALESLRCHAQSLDIVTRDEIRRVLTDELQPLDAEIAKLVRSAASASRSYSLRGMISTLTSTLMCALILVAVAHWVLPSAGQLAELEAQRNRLTNQLHMLEDHGARIELRRCGSTGRLCVRVDENAPRFGEHADFHVLAGY